MSSVEGEAIDVAIVGAGPAGLIAAEIVARAGLRTVVFDRMASPARKFLFAGRGGLNLSNGEAPERFLTRYGEAAALLAPALAAFTPADLAEWSAGLGQPAFIGSSGRMFPKSFKSTPLLRAWLARLDELGVTIRTRQNWRGWSADGALQFENADSERHAVHAKATLLALGGASWPRLGSDGGWIETAKAAHLATLPFRPANCGFKVDWPEVFAEKHQGQPLKRVAVTFGGRCVKGEALVTRYGIEGGAIYAISAPLRDAMANGRQIIYLDLRPDVSETTLLQRLSTPRNGQSLSSHLRKRAGLSPVAVALVREGLPKHLHGSETELAGLIKRLPVEMTAPQSIDRAISCAGGLSWSELDETLMLRRKPGVYCAGEMLDWEAPTGGYLLQACFSTGVLAARSIVSSLKR